MQLMITLELSSGENVAYSEVDQPKVEDRS